MHRIITSLLPRTFLVGLATLLVTSGLLLTPLAHAADQCPDSVVQCGITSTEDLNQKYKDQDSVKTVYHNFGISSVDVANMHDTAVTGYVTQGGRVMIGDKTVATDALTVGMQNIDGSKTVTANGITFYTRPPSVSFQQQKLESFVVMKDGVFQFAIIKSCGNPVTATPVKETPAPTPAPTPTPPETPAPQPQPTPAPTPAPAPVCSGDTTNTATDSAAAQGGNCSINTTTVLVCSPVNSPNSSVCSTTPPVTPAGSTAACQAITVSSSTSRQVSVTVGSNYTNAVVTGYTVDFGDGTPPQTVTTNNNNDTSTDVTTASTTAVADTSDQFTHTYAKDGSYVITASVQVKYADGHTETKTGDSCKRTISFNVPAPTPPVTPTVTPAAATTLTPAAPTRLVNTGSSISQTFGTAGIVALISSMGYFLVSIYRAKIFALYD